MKKIRYFLMLAGFLTTQAYTAPITAYKAKAPRKTLEQQLAKYVSYPDVLKSTQHAGIVVIQFRINSADELCQLEIFSQNDQLNHTLLRQLTGKKLAGYGNGGMELYTVRLHFQPG